MARLSGSTLVQTETWKHQNVFETYLLLGPGRNLAELSKQTGISVPVLQVWSRSFRWPARLEKRDSKAMMEIQKENDVILKESIMRRQQKAYQEVGEKALDQIKKFVPAKSSDSKSLKEAAFALDIAIAGERKVLGLADSKLKAGVVREGVAAFLEAAFSGG